MGKGGKVVVFIIVAFVLVLVATVMKEAGAGAVKDSRTKGSSLNW